MGSSSAQPVEQEALLNHLILANIFKYLNTQDLKSARLVCTAWDNESHTELRRKVPIIVRGKWEEPDKVDYVPLLLSEAPPGRTSYINRTLTEMVEYLDSLPESEMTTRLRYSTVVLQGWDFTAPTDKDERARFWAACSPGILDLHVIRCQFNINYHLESYLKLASKLERVTVDDKYLNRKNISTKGLTDYQKCLLGAIFDVTANENLKSVTVFCSELEPGEAAPMPWTVFLKGFPNLEKVILSSLDRTTSPVVKFNWNLLSNRASEVLGGLVMCCQMRRDVHKIRHVDMAKLDWPASGFLRPYLVPALTHRSEFIPLTTLKIDIGLAEIPNPWVSASTLVKTFASSLETLVLLRAPYTTEFPRALVASNFKLEQLLESLKTLELIGSVMFDLKFLRFTPNLKKLVVSPMHRTKYSVNLMDDETFRRDSTPFHRLHTQFANLVAEAEQSNAGLVLVNLTELEIGYQLQGPNSVELLGRWMPNVETLRIPATSGIFKEICRRWEHSLLTLELQNPSVLTDADITGIENGASALSPQVPNVTCLKKLKFFQMDHPHSIFHTPSECDHLVPQLTERSILHGFVELEKLVKLKIFVTTALGQECLQELETRRKDLRVVVEVIERCQCNV